MRAALARLTARQRTVLALRYFEDLPEAEVAGLLGCSVGTVRSTTHRSDKDDGRLANVSAHPDQTPPRDMIAAGDVAMTAYYTWDTAKPADGREFAVRTYRLLDPKTGTYVKTTKWARVAVAPGMRTAAVLERNLPAKRIGWLNMLTGEAERWIPVDHGVASVEFSPDGSKLVATTYSKNPDLVLHKVRRDINGDGDRDWIRQDDSQEGHTGFYVLDVASGKGSWSETTVVDALGTQDFSFSPDGKLLYSGTTSSPYRQFYDFAGKQVAAPANDAYIRRNEAGLSPDGKFVADIYMGPRPGGPRSALLDPRTRKLVTTVRGDRLLAWVDDKRLIAWDYTRGSRDVRLGLALVTIGGDEVVPLSGYSKGSDNVLAVDWTPVFAKR